MEFFLDGNKETVDTSTLSPETTLNEYVRNTKHLTGTKYMCREGGCGACIVAVRVKNPRTGLEETYAVNSCLVSILSCKNWQVTTIEGLGSRAVGYHPIQQKIVQFNGTQCGFCTPGMIMNMHALLESGRNKMAEIENAFGGNICRCTGYRPILAAFKSMAIDSNKDILGNVPDIEDFGLSKALTCPRICSDSGIDHSFKTIAYKLKNNSSNWYTVHTLNALFNVLLSRKGKTYKLVAGNTAKGVYWDMGKADYYIDIRQIPDLRIFDHDTTKLLLGGNVTIAEMMEVFLDAADKDDYYKHLKKVVEHLDLVATVPVRNIGTIAGNLTIKHIHNEFPSDIFLIFEVIKARLILDNGFQEEAVSPQHYLATSMAHKIIKRIEIPALDDSYRFESYKIMPKSQNAHAHINAGFLFKLTAENIVEDARIVFGGINPSFVHASNAEHSIIGRQLFDNSNIQTLFKKLDVELKPDLVLPDPSPEFRKQLAIALTYKFILSIAPESILSPFHKSGGQKLIRPAISKGTQDYKTHDSLYPVGKAINKLEAADQATGEAKYIMDMPDLPNQLFAAFVQAKAAAGSIVNSIDASAAMKLIGVEGFFQASDIIEMGGCNTFTPLNNTWAIEEEILFIPTNGKVQYYFQPLGIIAATSQSVAEEGAELVKVDYNYAQKSPLLSVREVLRENDTSRIIHDTTIVAKKQDNNVPNKLEGTFDINWQYHYHMECQVVNVRPDDDGGLIIRPSSQFMDLTQWSITNALNIPANKINIEIKRLGGAFGAKVTRNNWMTVAASLATLKLRKPIKFWLPMNINMNVMGKRSPISANYDVGFDNAGKLGYLNLALYTNVGIHINDRPLDLIPNFLTNIYNPDVIQLDYNLVRTDNHTSTWTRAPGSLPYVALMDSVMEHIACVLNKDPFDVKLLNLNSNSHSLLAKFMNEFSIWCDYRIRKTAADGFNKQNRWRKRGISLVPMVFRLDMFGTTYAQVSIYHIDGTVAICHGGIEMGQGLNTKAAQVAAFGLGIDTSLISVKPANNFTTPNTEGTFTSQTSENVGIAIKKACDILKKRIDDAAATAKLSEGSTWFEKVKNAFAMGRKLTQVEIYTPDPDDNYFIYGVSAAEVEVDILSGSTIIQRVDLLQEVGHSMSPFIDIGQVEGAYIMGLGYWTSEEIIHDKNGKLMTNRTWTYKPPGAKDIPVDFRVKFPDEPNPRNQFQSKGTGEPSICSSFAIPLAIRQALKSARQQANSNADRWMPINPDTLAETDGPCTIEWTFMNALNNYNDYKL